jgi:dihydrofolate synthase/folylpolyglutamate synthase
LTSAYRQTLDWLYGLEARRGMDFRLQRLVPVLAALGNPERAVSVIHVAGTNGKGSTAAMLASVYARAGYRTGLYTSPHLVSLRERIRVDGCPVAADDFVELVDLVRRATESSQVWLTFFEIVTLAAFEHFRRADVDVAVIETGLGGRLDATNVVDPLCAVITSVGLDHSEFLGPTRADIAREKAGVAKPGRALVTGALGLDAEREVAAAVARLGVEWDLLGRDFTSAGIAPAGATTPAALRPAFAGRHQVRNAALVRRVVERLQGSLPVAPEALATGLAEARWPGRMQWLAGEPSLVLDAAHNEQGMAVLAAELATIRTAGRRVLVFGVMADKNWAAMLERILPRVDAVVCVPVARQARALAPELAATWIGRRGPRPVVSVAASAGEGLEAARVLAGEGGLVVVAGSVFLAGELCATLAGDMGVDGDELAA